MHKLLVANWKENPKTELRALKLFKEIAAAKRGATNDTNAVDVIICPPFIYLEEIARSFRKLSVSGGAGGTKYLALGAQDVFWEERGAFTGEIGPNMLRSLGVRYVIIGHSERRRDFKETDGMINKKVLLALRDGLKVILCVGEPPAIRKKGIAAAKSFIKNQLKSDLAGLKNLRSGGARINAQSSLIIAYEPIWAIGTGKNDNPEDAAAMADFIKKTASVYFAAKEIDVLYGGSVNSKNVLDYVQYKSISGALVGGASLKSAEFGTMIARVGDR